MRSKSRVHIITERVDVCKYGNQDKDYGAASATVAKPTLAPVPVNVCSLNIALAEVGLVSLACKAQSYSLN